MLVMTPLADKTNGITIIAFGWQCCLILKANSRYLPCVSVILASKLLVNRVVVSINAASLFVPSILLCVTG
jgi:hypothetical protein